MDVNADSIILRFDQSIDNLINSGAQKTLEALATPSADFLLALGGASLGGWALLHALRGSFSFDGFLNFITRFALIYMFVSGGVLMTTYIFPFITGFGPSVGTAILSNMGGATTSSGGVVAAFAGFISESVDAVWSAVSTMGWGAYWNGDAAGIMILAVLCVIIVLVQAAVTLGLILVTKIFMAIFIAITPVLAVWAFLKSTADVFNGWIKGVTLLMLLQVLLYGVMGIMMAAAKGMQSEAGSAIQNGQEITAQLFTFALISGVGIVCLFAVPMIARTVGGASINLGENWVRDTFPKMTRGGADMLQNSGGGRDPVGNAAREASRAEGELRASSASPDSMKQMDAERGRATAQRHARSNAGKS